jgi:hypothetical protein
MRVGRIGVAVATVAVLASACGGVGNDDTGSGGSTGATGAIGIEHPTGADQLILRVAYEGGFVPYEYTLGSTPFWSLFGDGTLIVPGPQIEIYPGPALPNLTATPVSEDGIQAILEAARDAGLMDGDANYGNQCIADAATTVFTTTADGTTSVVSRVRARRRGARRHLREREGRRRPREAGGVPGEAHRPAELAAGRFGRHRTALRPDRDARVRPPLPGRRGAAAGSDRVAARAPLDAFGEPVQNGPGHTRCGVVTGEDLTPLLAAAGKAKRPDPMDRAAGRRYHLIFRPLLPDEHAR